VKDWVQYHNSHKLGFPKKANVAHAIFWKKNTSPEIGDRIWLIASVRAKPTYEYYLVDQFVVDTLGDHRASGVKGSWHGRSVRIDNKLWFSDFRHFMGNFGRGLSAIPLAWSKRLETVAPVRSSSVVAPLSPRISSAPRNRSDLSVLDASRTRIVRLEQQAIRRLLLQGRSTGVCTICGSKLPVALLIASHIKRREECSDAEKRDYDNNVVLMCTLGCDSLFERGFISVQAGQVVAGPTASSLAAVRVAIVRLTGRKCASYSPLRAKYFNWRHRNPV
jgi:hypothetical protein